MDVESGNLFKHSSWTPLTGVGRYWIFGFTLHDTALNSVLYMKFADPGLESPSSPLWWLGRIFCKGSFLFVYFSSFVFLVYVFMLSRDCSILLIAWASSPRIGFSVTYSPILRIYTRRSSQVHT